MANDNEVKLILTAEDNVSSAVKKVMDALGTTGLGQAVTAVSTSFLAMGQAVDVAKEAINKVVDQFEKAIDAASEMEVTNKKLALSLAATGDYSKESFDKIVEWSDGVERTLGMSNEAAIQLVILGKNMGMTADQAQKAASAALDLAAATGQDANAAMRQMSMTLQGVEGRLGKMVPEVDGLTKAQLRNGEAIDLIAKKYEGFASSTAQTFVGSSNRLKVSIENIYEAFGRMIVQNPLITRSMDALANTVNSIAQTIDQFSSYILNNIDKIKNYGTAFLIAAGLIALYTIAINASTIATTALTMATIVFNTVSKLTPWGIAIAAVGVLTVAIGYMIDNWEKVSAVMKIVFGNAIQLVVGYIKLMTTHIRFLIGIFNDELAKTIDDAIGKMDAYGKQMEETGSQAYDTAKALDNMGKEGVNAADVAAMAAKGLGNSISIVEQAARRSTAEYGRALNAAKDAFDKLADVAPGINLDKFKEDAIEWEKSLKDLIAKAKNQKAILAMKPQEEGTDAEIAKVSNKIAIAEQALGGLKLKRAQETREARLKEVDLELQRERYATISLADEIMLKKVDAAKKTRDQLIQIETERLLSERGLHEANARAGIDVKTAAFLEANKVELQAYQARLDAEMSMAVSVENQKQMALAQARATASGGLGKVAEAESNVDVVIKKEEERQAKLTALYERGAMTQEKYDSDMARSRIAQVQATTDMEIQKAIEREEALGLTEAGLQARIDKSNLEAQQRLDTLIQQKDMELITEEEYNLRKLAAEQQNADQMRLIKENYLKEEIARNQALGNNWAATLGQIRLEQQKHGQVLGAMRGIAQSQELDGVKQSFNNIATFQNTKSRSLFEIGKAAAIASATINTFQGATKALAEYGPILGPILAATTVAAGMVQIANIKAQKFPSGQADQGIDYIPQSMSGKSFVVSGGERILQPAANKDITEAAKTINEKGGNATNNITVNVTGNVDEAQISRMKEAIIDAVRSASERGQPVVHERGIVRA